MTKLGLSEKAASSQTDYAGDPFANFPACFAATYQRGIILGAALWIASCASVE